MVDAFHCNAIPQPELEEQLPSGSATSTGAVGGFVLVPLPVITKVSTVDHADTSVVVTESRAWRRQYQVPVARVGDQVVPVIQPEDEVIVEKEELELTCTEY